MAKKKIIPATNALANLSFGLYVERNAYAKVSKLS